MSSATNDLRIVRIHNALADELTNTILTAITSGVVPPGTTAAPGADPDARGPRARRRSRPAGEHPDQHGVDDQDDLAAVL